IKPANILIGANGQVKVADFGIARAMNAPTESNLTQAGSVMGTATYFSPEQAQGAQPDPRSDLYSLGIVLYEMVAGRPPFSGENPVSIAYKQVHEQPQPLNQLVADVPKPFEAIVAKLLAKKADVRYSTAEAVRDDLRRYRNGEPVQALTSAMGAAPATTAVPRAAGGAVVAGAAVGATVGLPRTTAQPGMAGTGAMPRTGAQPQQYQPQQYDAGGRGGMYAVIGFLALIALVVGGIVLFNALSKDDQPSSFPMPAVVGALLEEGTTVLDEAGLQVNPPVIANDPAFPPGAIVLTEPAAGTTVQRGQAVTIYYNPVLTPFALEEMAGKTQEDAVLLLQGQGLVPKVVTEDNPDVEAGVVIRTEPPAGTMVQQGDEIVVVVSAAANEVSVPPVAGLSQADANATLTTAAYEFVVTVELEASPDVQAGVAIRTDPAAGELVEKGSPVTLFVSSGPEPVKVPPLEGLTEASARAKLLELGLVPDVSYQAVPIGDSKDGRVISQSVPSGTDV
ncbi:MAG: PASTA domain-containing protein, partial [Actinomycetota bacterium]|nr:PASTA domain-containing protein [Actinomycetota bacterium]